MMPSRGDPVIFEFSSSNASTAAAISIRDAGGSSRTLAATERLVINSYTAVLASGANPSFIFDDINADGNVDAGEKMAVLGTGVNILSSAEGPDGGISGGLGRTPKVKAAASGQIDIVGVGYIQKT